VGKKWSRSLHQRRPNDLSQARELGVNCSSEGIQSEAVYKPSRMAMSTIREEREDMPMLGSEAELFETVININDDMQNSIARYLNMMTIRKKNQMSIECGGATTRFYIVFESADEVEVVRKWCWSGERSAPLSMVGFRERFDKLKMTRWLDDRV
jgi:hypothetical protein